jgi:hypothetical protein
MAQTIIKSKRSLATLNNQRNFHGLKLKEKPKKTTKTKG